MVTCYIVTTKTIPGRDSVRRILLLRAGILYVCVQILERGGHFVQSTPGVNFK